MLGPGCPQKFRPSAFGFMIRSVSFFALGILKNLNNSSELDFSDSRWAQYATRPTRPTLLDSCTPHVGPESMASRLFSLFQGLCGPLRSAFGRVGRVAYWAQHEIKNQVFKTDLPTTPVP